jgi:hypothetical protein
MSGVCTLFLAGLMSGVCTLFRVPQVNTYWWPWNCLSERDPVGRCRFCGYLYYSWKLPVHEAICSMRPVQVLRFPFSQTSTPLTLQESHSSAVRIGRSYIRAF